MLARVKQQQNIPCSVSTFGYEYITYVIFTDSVASQFRLRNRQQHASCIGD